MQITDMNNDGLAREFKVTLPAQKIQEAIDKRLQNIAATAKIDGFRSGKAPITLIKKKYEHAVTGEVIEEQIAQTMDTALKEKKYSPAFTPKVEIGMLLRRYCP